MKNWSVDENYMKKFPKAYELWKLEQLLAYGFDEEDKFEIDKIKKNWSYLKNRLDEKRRKSIEFIIS